MNEIVRFAADEMTPDGASVLAHQGIPAGARVSAKIEALRNGATALLMDVAVPVGIVAEISKEAFADVYRGVGLNEPATPVGDIYGRADRLALFVVTLGKAIGREIEERFRSNDLAMGSMLDSAASVAADVLAGAAEARFRASLPDARPGAARTVVMRYSPGYCGWHLSGQRALFDCLRPQRVGVVLRDSFLMDPLKSVSGVMIAGPADTHSFEAAYPFCSECVSRGCRERLRAAAAV